MRARIWKEKAAEWRFYVPPADAAGWPVLVQVRRRPTWDEALSAVLADLDAQRAAP